MATTALDAPSLQRAAKKHLWMHFTRMGGFEAADVPIIVRGEGCHLEDANGRRYIDALAGLFSVNIGYSYGEEIGQAALEQMRELPFYTNWSYAHPREIELAAAAGERRRQRHLPDRARDRSRQRRVAVPQREKALGRSSMTGGRLPRGRSGEARGQPWSRGRRPHLCCATPASRPCRTAFPR